MKDDPEWATTDGERRDRIKKQRWPKPKVGSVADSDFFLELNGDKEDDEKFCVVLRADEQCACRTRMKMVIEPGGRLQ